MTDAGLCCDRFVFKSLLFENKISCDIDFYEIYVL